MYVACVAFALAGFLAFVAGVMPGFGENTDEAARTALAHNFLVQCSALSDALSWSTSNSPDTAGASGQGVAGDTLDPAALLLEAQNWLPPGYEALGDWQATADDNFLYLHGTLDTAADSTDTALSFELSRLAGTSLVAGMRINGQLEPPGLSLPSSIPERALVCGIARP